MISHLLAEVVQFTPTDHILVLNSAADPFVAHALRNLATGSLVLAEDNVAVLGSAMRSAMARRRQPLSVPFYEYMTRQDPATMDVAVVNLLYQPSKAWMLYSLSVAAFALRVGGRFYATGAKDRGILTLAKRMQELFGNVVTLEISKGHRVLCSTKRNDIPQEQYPATALTVFADSQLDDGTRMLLEALEGQELSPAMQALDLGCGAGFIGVYLARRAVQGHVTLVDTSLTAIAASQRTIDEAGFASSVTVLASDGVQAVREQHFDVVATNPPFHQGGMQNREIAERFIGDAAQVLVPQGKLFLVANRFLKYEPTMQACFRFVREIHGDSRYKVLCASNPQK